MTASFPNSKRFFSAVLAALEKIKNDFKCKLLIYLIHCNMFLVRQIIYFDHFALETKARGVLTFWRTDSLTPVVVFSTLW